MAKTIHTRAFPNTSRLPRGAGEDLLNWHQQYVYPNNIIFGITGDFDPKAMEAKLRQAFDSWRKDPTPRNLYQVH